MKFTKFLAAFTIMITIAYASNAQEGNHRSDYKKIKQGVKSGELTKKETYNLAKQQHAIRKDVRQAKADGVITCNERKDIRKDKLKADANIYRKKHNGRDRN